MSGQTATVTAIELEGRDTISVDPKNHNVEVQAKGRVLGETPAPVQKPVPVEIEPPKLSTSKAWILIIQLVGNNFIGTFGEGMLMVCLPTIARDLDLAPNLLLWPASVTYLASASFLLIAGSVSDVLGPRRLNTTGSFLQCMFIIATGLSKTGPQLLVFRTFKGIVGSVFSTSGRSMLSTNIERGRLRNFAFAAFMLAFPLGAGLGLVLGGVYASKSSWRVGYWSSGAVGLLLSLSSVWTLPPDPRKHTSFSEARKRLASEIDWVGVFLASASLTILCYVLA